MKTFKQFINESEAAHYTTGGAKALLEWLKKQSPEATSAYTISGHTLIRGQRGSMGTPVYTTSDEDYLYNVYKVKTNKTRKPVDTPKKTSEMLDAWFAENGYGQPRSEGVFTVVGDDSSQAASSYGNGNVYAIFPVQPAIYVWSPEVYDLYETVNEFTIEAEVDTPDQLTAEHINTLMSRVDWKKSDSPLEAINGGNALGGPMEVVVQCDEFLCLHIENRSDGPIRHTNQFMNVLTGG